MPDDGKPSASAWESVKVKLDPIHAMMRVEKRLSKNHGAYAVFMARFRDAIFVPDAEGISRLKERLRREGMAAEAIEKKYHTEYTWFLARVCRRIGSPDDLLERLHLVEKEYADLPDYKTSQPLFTAKVWEEWRKFKQHVTAGCLSDPPDIPLYIEVYIDGATEPVLMCFRGTSPLEGYHLHVRKVLSGYNYSPRLALDILRDFNFRWNATMSTKHGLIPIWMGEFGRQHILEEVQEITEIASWATLGHYLVVDASCRLNPLCKGYLFRFYAQRLCSEPMFSAWKSTKHYQDTCEPMGLLPKLPKERLASLQKTPVDTGDNDEHNSEDEEVNEGLVGEAVPFLNLKPSARWCFEEMGRRWASPVRTETERTLFSDMLPRFISKSANPDQHGAIDWDSFATAWNSQLSDSNSKDVYRKLPSHLEKHWTYSTKQRNQRLTMKVHAEVDSKTCSLLRPAWRPRSKNPQHPTTEVLHMSPQRLDSMSCVPIPESSLKTADRVVVCPLPVVTWSDGKPTCPAQSAKATADANAIPVEGPSSETADWLRLKHCRSCGHVKFYGKWKDQHVDGSCNVETQTRPKRRTQCTCADCQEIKKLYWQHERHRQQPGGSKPERKCSTCGHHYMLADWRDHHTFPSKRGEVFQCKVHPSLHSIAMSFSHASYNKLCCPCLHCQKHFPQLAGD
eukprot:scaffold24665_cov44-Prasinocladus_malaysianus.AAC.1